MRPATGSKGQERPGFVALQEAPIFPFHCLCWCEGGENARPARRGAMPPTLMMGQILGQEKCWSMVGIILGKALLWQGLDTNGFTALGFMAGM